MRVLAREFYERDVITVAQELLGKYLVFNGKRGKIVETEAYLGDKDPASHNKEMFYGPGGMAYVFLNYGLHWCFNVTAEKPGKAGCVLIRGIEGVSGPGRVTKYFGITGKMNGWDVTNGKLVVEDGEKVEFEVLPRVGISNAVDLKLRFLVEY